MTKPSIGIIGGSVVGLACAWWLAKEGYSVTIHAETLPGEPARDGAGWVAGGMLGAYTEAWPGEDDMLTLGVASLCAWEKIFAGLGKSDADRMITGRGTVVTGVDDSDKADVDRIAAFLSSHEPGATETMNRKMLREKEPALARVVRGGIVCEKEYSVDNRQVLAVYAEQCLAMGVTWVTETVGAVTDLPEDIIVVAAGAGGCRLVGLPVREVKGEVLRLKKRDSSVAAPNRTIRARVHGRALYLVPRPWGLAVGATEYEHGHDTTPTAGGVRELLDDAFVVFPGIDDYAFTEVIAGVRPYSPDNKPMIGEITSSVAPDWVDRGRRVVAACGHGRNGILMSAITAEMVHDIICRGDRQHRLADLVHPDRFGDTAR